MNQEKWETAKKESLEAIEKEGITAIYNIYPYIKIGKTAFYRYGLHHDEEILTAINNNCIKRKAEIFKKLSVSNSPAALIAAYKLLANKDERKKLADKFDDDNNLTIQFLE